MNGLHQLSSTLGRRITAQKSERPGWRSSSAGRWPATPGTERKLRPQLHYCTERFSIVEYYTETVHMPLGTGHGGRCVSRDVTLGGDTGQVDGWDRGFLVFPSLAWVGGPAFSPLSGCLGLLK